MSLVRADCTPTLLGSYDTPDEAWSIGVVGDVAFVADGGAGLQMINVSGCLPCAADPSGDGKLDIFDFLAFVKLFNAGC